ncbi:hypothetical protein FGO68_gene12706 [Halteria grandinella]|uniref:Uncharacterized protein n=1 Tax=Halteria grandinella TaxID=5974 RepID=A0A8J8NW63_HALGN|nr:hypothetical protein FGO68_gene12706 [Halteria grandinella]
MQTNGWTQFKVRESCIQKLIVSITLRRQCLSDSMHKPKPKMLFRVSLSAEKRQDLINFTQNFKNALLSMKSTLRVPVSLNFMVSTLNSINSKRAQTESSAISLRQARQISFLTITKLQLKIAMCHMALGIRNQLSKFCNQSQNLENQKYKQPHRDRQAHLSFPKTLMKLQIT